MTAMATPTRFTAKDLLALNDDKLYELVDGKLVEKEMSSLASRVAAIISSHLSSYSTRASGATFNENSYDCFLGDRVRRPDVSFIVAARMSQVPDEGHCPIPPDLAVEVVSPNDTIYQLDEKLDDYHAAGIPLVWIVDPKARSVRVKRLGKPSIELEESDTLTGDDVLPGFSVGVKDLFPAEPAATENKRS